MSEFNTEGIYALSNSYVWFWAARSVIKLVFRRLDWLLDISRASARL